MLKTALGQSPVFRYAKHISTSVNFFFFFGGGGDPCAFFNFLLAQINF